MLSSRPMNASAAEEHHRARPGRTVVAAIGWLVTLASVFAMATFQASDPDLGFHLATGREVLATGRIPATNVLSFAQTEHSWLLHQWAPGVLFELVHRRWGVAAVILTKASIVCLTWAFVLAATRRLGARLAPAGCAVLVGATAAAFRFVERPLLASHLALAVVVWLLALHATPRSGAARWRRSTPLVAAALALAVTAHLHAGVLYPALLVFAFSVGTLMDPVAARALRRAPPATADGSAPATGPRGALPLFAVLVGGFSIAAATLALYHPYGARVLGVPFRMGSDTYLYEHIVEFRAPWSFPASYLRTYWIVALAALSTVVVTLRRGPLARTLALGGFLLLSLRWARLAYALAIVATPWIALEVDRFAGRFRVGRSPLVAGVTLAALACLGPLENWSRFPPGLGYNPHHWPIELFGVLDDLEVRGDVFTSDRWAGPLLGLYYPERRSFFDTRIEAFDAAFIEDEYQAARYGQPGWDATLDRYDVQAVLMAHTSPGEARLQGGEPNLRQFLSHDGRWALVAFDDHGALWVRADGPNAEVAARWEIEGVDPDRPAFFPRPAASAAHLARAVDRGPASPRLLALAAVAFADSGRSDLAAETLERARRMSPDSPVVEAAESMVNELSR